MIKRESGSCYQHDSVVIMIVNTPSVVRGMCNVQSAVCNLYSAPCNTKCVECNNFHVIITCTALRAVNNALRE